MPARRQVLLVGGGVIAALGLPDILQAMAVETVEMCGTARGERVWFAPAGLAVMPGTTVRFINRDGGNSHTATAYHPDLYDRPRRIPERAEPWDSDFLLPGDSFEITLTVPGVYDYYCLPHEMAGMIGRIVVGRPGDPGWQGPAADGGDIAPEFLVAIPTVGDIIARGRVPAQEAL